MKLVDKQVVEGTTPKIHIGRRTYKTKRKKQIRTAKPYWAEYFIHGKQYQVPLGTANKVAAIRAAYVLSERLERGQLMVSDGKRTVPELVERYKSYCEAKQLAKKTLTKYEGQLNRFAAWCRDRGIRVARTFAPDDLFAYRTYLLSVCHLAEKSIYHETILIKQIFKWAARNGYLAKNLISPIQFKKVKSPKQPCFTIDQVEILLANAEKWAAPIFATLAYTGIRIGELQQLCWEDVDLECNVVHICRGGSEEKPKDKEDRFIPIHAGKLKPILRTLPRESELVFLMPNSRKVSQKKLLAYLKRLCKECGFENPRQYKVHTFRHFFASYCAQQNLSYKYALEWMGHSSSAILDLYFTMNDRHSQAAMNSLTFSSENAENRTVLGQSGGVPLQTNSQTKQF